MEVGLGDCCLKLDRFGDKSRSSFALRQTHNMDHHLVLPYMLCKVTWIVTLKIAKKICITEQDLAT